MRIRFGLSVTSSVPLPRKVSAFTGDKQKPDYPVIEFGIHPFGAGSKLAPNAVAGVHGSNGPSGREGPEKRAWQVEPPPSKCSGMGMKKGAGQESSEVVDGIGRECSDPSMSVSEFCLKPGRRGFGLLLLYPDGAVPTKAS